MINFIQCIVYYNTFYHYFLKLKATKTIFYMTQVLNFKPNVTIPMVVRLPILFRLVCKQSVTLHIIYSLNQLSHYTQPLRYLLTSSNLITQNHHSTLIGCAQSGTPQTNFTLTRPLHTYA